MVGIDFVEVEHRIIVHLQKEHPECKTAEDLAFGYGAKGSPSGRLMPWKPPIAGDCSFLREKGK